MSSVLLRANRHCARPTTPVTRSVLPVRKGSVVRQQLVWYSINVNDNSWEDAVEKASHQQPVIVDFWAKWCGPCRVLGPILEQAVDKVGGVTFAKYDIDESSGISDKFNVSSIPYVVAISRGKSIKSFVGGRPPEDVEDFVRQVKAEHDGTN